MVLEVHIVFPEPILNFLQTQYSHNQWQNLSIGTNLFWPYVHMANIRLVNNMPVPCNKSGLQDQQYRC